MITFAGTAPEKAQDHRATIYSALWELTLSNDALDSLRRFIFQVSGAVDQFEKNMESLLGGQLMVVFPVGIFGFFVTGDFATRRSMALLWFVPGVGHEPVCRC